MNRNLRLIQNDLRIWYYRYKDSSYFALVLSALVIIASVVLFFQTVIPQFRNWFSIREEVLRTREQIANIDKNISFLTSVDKEELNDRVQTSVGSLPVEKSFGGIINALSDSAITAGVVLNDFSFEVGNIASSEGELKIFGEDDLSTVKISLSLLGSINNISDFVKQVQQKIPLSEVSAVDNDSFSTTVSIQFFQKELPKIVYKDDVPLAPLSSSQLALLKKLAEWKPSIAQTEEAIGSESASSVPLF